MTDASDDSRPLSERVRDLRLVEQALARAVNEALRMHKRLGNPVAVWRDGEVVWLAPEDIPVPDGE